MANSLSDGNAEVWNNSPSVVGTSFWKLRTPMRRALHVGTHCSGLCAETLALEHMDIPHKSLFACDSSEAVQTLLQCSFDIGMFFHDILHASAVEMAPHVDLYVNGFPCPPCSRMGNNLGPRDPRSQVVYPMLQYLESKLPTCFVLENVASITNSRHADYCMSIIDALEALQDPVTQEPAYTVFMGLCDSMDMGLPQSRKRFFVVGALNRCYGNAHGNPEFFWPALLPPANIVDFLDKDANGELVKGNGGNDDPSLLSQVSLRNLIHMQQDFDAIAMSPADFHVIVDICASPTRQHYTVGHCPTITKARGEEFGFYITSLNRTDNMKPIMKLIYL